MSERLPRLPMGMAIMGRNGRPSKEFQYFWQRFCEEIESSRSTMDDIKDVTIAADHTGKVLSGELPRNIAAKRYFLDDDVTTSATWSFTVTSGSVTATIGASTGVLNITAVGAAESTVKITSVRQGLSVSRTFRVLRVNGATPSGSGGGTSAADSTFVTISAATHAAISDELTVTTGSAGQVDLAAPLQVKTDAVSPDGTFEVFGKWLWYDGAAWVDVAVEVASDPDCVVLYDAETGAYFVGEGSISVSAVKTGLPASSSQKFRLMGRNASGTRTMYFSGTASAVGS